MTDGPLIVQSDKTLLLEVDHPEASEARAAIAPAFRITPKQAGIGEIVATVLVAVLALLAT